MFTPDLSRPCPFHRIHAHTVRGRPGAVAQSYENCHQIARAARSNFYYAFYLLPKFKRDGLAALYAFMRLVDDVADDREIWRPSNVVSPSGVRRLMKLLQAFSGF